MNPTKNDFLLMTEDFWVDIMCYLTIAVGTNLWPLHLPDKISYYGITI